jgi:hypothetical protein
VQAMSIFEQAHVICARDNGALWGHTLCGPMLLVDGDDRSVVTNAPDADGLLKKDGEVWVGTLPPAQPMSDTTITFSGTRWCELLWPWPMREDDELRHVTLAHETFHRIEVADLHMQMLEGNNAHLDTLEGRTLIELEGRALAAAVQATDPAARRTAIADALLFRRERYRVFPAAAENERDLETNEGIAEYTGVRLGLTTPEDRVRYALRDLATLESSASLVRSFAYGTGPAYGLLLDRENSGWRPEFLASQLSEGLEQRLADAMRLPASDFSQLAAREAIYDADGSLRAHETARDEERRAEVARYRARLVDGPVLMLPLAHYSYEFKPQTLVPLGDRGTVYPTMTLRDAWGTIVATSGGVLIAGEAKAAYVSAAGFDPSTSKGDGYTLRLEPGWTVNPGVRKGDLVVVRAEASGH